jgi:hypothetical protein
MTTSHDPQWLQWAKRIQALAQSWLTYTSNPYDVERHAQRSGKGLPFDDFLSLCSTWRSFAWSFSSWRDSATIPSRSGGR